MNNLVSLALMVVMLNYQSLVAQQTTTLVVEFETIANPSGTLHIGIYEKDNFLRKPILAKTVEVNSSSQVVDFENVDPGVYAISVFQDLNNNKTMDFEATGMPIEPWTTSGSFNPYGPPVWDDAKFTLKAGENKVHLRI